MRTILLFAWAVACAPYDPGFDTASTADDKQDPVYGPPTAGRSVADPYFAKTKDTVNDPYGYKGDKSDGCFARQYMICSDILNSGSLPANCQVVSLFAEWAPPKKSGTYAWTYHTACAVTCVDPNECWAIDGLSTSVQSCTDWFTKWTQAPPGGTTTSTRAGPRLGPTDTTSAYSQWEHDWAKKFVADLNKKP